MSDDLRERVARAIKAAFAEHTEIASLSDAVADAMADAALAEIGEPAPSVRKAARVLTEDEASDRLRAIAEGKE